MYYNMPNSNTYKVDQRDEGEVESHEDEVALPG